MDIDAKIAQQYDPAATKPLPFKRATTRYPKSVLVRMDETMLAALEQAANDHHASREELIRCFIAAGLGDLWQLPKGYIRREGRRRRQARPGPSGPGAAGA